VGHQTFFIKVKSRYSIQKQLNKFFFQGMARGRPKAVEIAGKQNFQINPWFATVLPTLRTTDLE
jgi:hypothetical protein